MVTVTSYLKSTLVSDRGVSCPHCFSALLWTESCDTPLRIRSGASDGHPLPIWKTDDLALLSHSHVQEKTPRVNTFAKEVGLNISSKKPKIMTLNTTDTRPVQIDNEELPHTDRFTYLASIISRDGGTDLDIQNHLNKARNSLNMMNKVWHSSTYSTLTKLKLYHSCVLTTLLYGSECWRSL